MNRRNYLLLDVFTDRMFGGNQLAVFPDGSGLTHDIMQAIARELNLSETVFVFPGNGGANARLRFFTPAMELPFAGHPTIGAAVALASAGGSLEGLSHVVFAEEVGPVPVTIERRGSGIFAATLTSPQLPERLTTDLSVAEAAELAGVAHDDIAPLGPLAYSAGVPFHFLPLTSVEKLSAVTLNLQCWESHLAGSTAPHVVVLAMHDWRRGREVHLRMFAPLMGISEDPATGAAAAALAGLLVDQQKPGDGTHCWVVHQGEAMGRPSTIHLEVAVADGRPATVRVGGTAVIVGRGTLEGLPDAAAPAAIGEAGSACHSPPAPSAAVESHGLRPRKQAAVACVLLTGFAACALALSPTPAHAQQFTGPRVELSAGYDSLASNHSYSDFPASLRGIHGRVAVGYDAVVTRKLVLGIETSIGASSGASKTVTPGQDSFSFRPGRDIDVLARVGYQVGARTLLYVKAGWANASVDLVERERIGTNQYEVTKSTATDHGIRLGAGLEFRVSKRVYAKAEYRYTNFGDGYAYQPGTHRDQLLIGAGYRF